LAYKNYVHTTEKLIIYFTKLMFLKANKINIIVEEKISIHFYEVEK